MKSKAYVDLRQTDSNIHYPKVFIISIRVVLFIRLSALNYPTVLE